MGKGFDLVWVGAEDAGRRNKELASDCAIDRQAKITCHSRFDNVAQRPRFECGANEIGILDHQRLQARRTPCCGRLLQELQEARRQLTSRNRCLKESDTRVVLRTSRHIHIRIILPVIVRRRLEIPILEHTKKTPAMRRVFQIFRNRERIGKSFGGGCR